MRAGATVVLLAGWLVLLFVALTMYVHTVPAPLMVADDGRTYVCQEDQSCWRCDVMGNRQCFPNGKGQ